MGYALCIYTFPMYLIGFLSALNLLFSCNGKQFTFLFFQRTEKEKTSLFSFTFSHYFVQCCFVVVFHFVRFPGNKIHSRISFCVFEMLLFSKKKHVIISKEMRTRSRNRETTRLWRQQLL